MRHLKLTDKHAKTLEHDGSAQCIYWDLALQGFGLRVYASGKKSWVFRYQKNYKKHITVLGDAANVSITFARQQAIKLLAEVAQGGDPVVEVKRSLTFGELAHIYIERHAKLHKKTAKEDVKKLKSTLAQFCDRKADKISREQILAWHAASSKTSPYQANRSLALLRGIYNKGMQWDLVKTNPAQHVQLNRERSRERFLSQDEIDRLLAAVKEERQEVRVAMLLLMLTGKRKNEILSATWDQVDWINKWIQLPETKSGRIGYAYLSSFALRLLRELPKTSDRIFGTDLRRAWDRIRESADLPDVRLHDLRRSLGSWLAQQGYSLHLIAHVLDHAAGGVTAVYARFQTQDIRAALEAYSDYISTLLGCGQSR